MQSCPEPGTGQSRKWGILPHFIHFFFSTKSEWMRTDGKYKSQLSGLKWDCGQDWDYQSEMEFEQKIDLKFKVSGLKWVGESEQQAFGSEGCRIHAVLAFIRKKPPDCPTDLSLLFTFNFIIIKNLPKHQTY